MPQKARRVENMERRQMGEQEVREAFAQRARVTTALKAVIDTVVETVAEAGQLGVPGGHLYAGLMPIDIELDTFEQIMAVLVKAGKLRKVGELYFAGRVSLGKTSRTSILR
jgi:hypothetical protein